MKLHHSLVALIGAVVLTGVSHAEDVAIAYPTVEEASFVITAPDTWKLDPAEESGGYFDLNGPTGCVFSFRTIKGSEEALMDAIKESVADIQESYKDVELGEAQDWTPNGLKGFYAVGTGKDKEDGSKVRFGVGWCALKDNKIAELWFVADEADEAGMNAASKIANSLEAP